MTNPGNPRPLSAAIKATVTTESGSDRRECIISDAAAAGCRLTGNVEGLPDVICVQVSGVAKPMKGRIVSRDPGSVDVSFSWSQAPQAVDNEGPGDAPSPAAPTEAEQEASARRVADEIIRLSKRLEPSIPQH